MRGLALEGGGSRGAYHIGVVKAFLEEKYTFDGFVGTSIGAVNAAVLAQGDYEKALELWSNLSMENLFNTDMHSLIRIGKAKWDMNIITNVRGSLKKVIDAGGIDTSRIREIVSGCVDEDRLRSSSKDFGLVTLSVTERRPYELLLEDIPQGELLQYIMASACFPGFKSEIINQNRFIDGALYNNCPVNLLLKKGYDEIIIVRTLAHGIYRKFMIPDGVDVRVISPSEDLGNVMIFSRETIERNIKMGYLDGLRSLRGLRGYYYYLNSIDSNESLTWLISLEDSAIMEVGKLLGITDLPVNRMLFECIIPKLGRYLRLKKDFDYADFVIALLEYAAHFMGIERYQIYDHREFVSMIREKQMTSEMKASSSRNFIPRKISSLKYDAALNVMLQHTLATMLG